MKSPESPELQAAVAEVLRGNQDAFRLIVRAYGLPLRSYLASQVYHLDDVDDLAQEVFLTAYNSLHTFRPGEDLGAWLRGIARHKLQHFFRDSARLRGALARLREQIASTIEADLDRAAQDENAESIEALLRCVSRLPERLRRVVRTGLEGGKPATLAAELGTSVGAVYNLHYRANQLLRECLRRGLG